MNIYNKLPSDIQIIISKNVHELRYSNVMKQLDKKVSMLVYHGLTVYNRNINPEDISNLYEREYDTDCGAFGNIIPTKKYISINVHMQRKQLYKELKQCVRNYRRRYTHSSRKYRTRRTEIGYIKYWRFRTLPMYSYTTYLKRGGVQF